MKCQGTNREGGPCGKHAMLGRDFCKTHGGSKPRGPAHPGFKHGRRSKHIPTYLAAKYKESLDDPELLEYRKSIALLTARRKAIVEAAESELLWAKAQAAFKDLIAANNAKDEAGIKASLNVLHDLIMRGHKDSLRWREVYDLIEREGRMKEREHKRLAQMEVMISAEDHLATIGIIVNAIAEAVKDTDTLRRITRSIDAIWMAGGGGNRTVH